MGFALHLVLRLVGDVGRAAPADEEDHRARVHLGVRRGEQRVAGFLQPAAALPNLVVLQTWAQRAEVCCRRGATAE